MNLAALLVSIVAAIAPSPAQQQPVGRLRVADPPSRPFVARGIVPVRTGSTAELVRTSSTTGEQVRKVLAGAAWTLLEVSAWVPAGTRSVEVLAGAPRPVAPGFVSGVLAFTKRPQLVLELEGQAGDSERLSLGTGRAWVWGGLRSGFAGVAHSRTHGTMRWWTVASAGDERVWLTLRWENAVDASGRARGEFLLRSAKLSGLPAGVGWWSQTPDPSVAGGYLVRPSDHVFPQRGVRDFRLVFAPAKWRVDQARAADGWACADWSGGGFMPAGLKVPPVPGAAQAVAGRAREEWLRFGLLAGTGGAVEAPRLSWLWPYAGVPYGGMTGEVDVWPYDGALTAMTGMREGLATHLVLFQRYALRQPLTWEADGGPLLPEKHLEAGGSAPWSTYDFAFQRQYGAPGGTNDAPFEFDQVAKPTGPRAYTFEQAGVAPIDFQHLVRATKDARALVWLDGDPAAAEWLVCVAEHARATFWPGPGRAHRLQAPALPGRGWEVGRAEVWAAGVVVPAAMLGRAGMREWAQVLADGCLRAVPPCGLWPAARYGKAAETPPMGSRFLVQRGNELAYFAGMLREMEVGLGMGVEALLEAGRQGTRGMAWAPGFGGCWDRYVIGTADGAVLYPDRSAVPAGVYDPATLERWTYYSGNLTGSFDLPELAAEWRRAVGLELWSKPVARDGSPLEVWLPALSRWP